MKRHANEPTDRNGSPPLRFSHPVATACQDIIELTLYLSPMNTPVTRGAQSDQILLNIVSELAPAVHMVNLQLSTSDMHGPAQHPIASDRKSHNLGCCRRTNLI